MQQIIDQQRQFFYTNETKDIQFRKRQLKQFRQMLENYESDIYEALKADLNKSKQEAFLTEVGLLYTEIDFALKHLSHWMKKEAVPAPLTHKGTSSYIIKEPFGVALVIAPWNYPIQLSFLPVISALAAGNTAVLKPSEFAPHVSELINKMVTEYFDANYFTVIEGEKETSEALLEKRFDYIFFTGSTPVGKIVMEKASKFLTPVTLELGGKSPAIIDKSANVSLSAKRIAWGKFTNAGQTCVAPDYIFVHEKVYKSFMKAIKKSIKKFYGKNPLENPDYVRIINKKHFDRLKQYLDDGQIALSGETNEATLKIAPTLLEGVHENASVMQEEIFGPILPVIPFKELNDVIDYLQPKEKPLALYYFGENKKNQRMVTEHLSFGGGCINDSLYHLANPHLPFGGVGESGIGHYHGKFGFDTFSHQKSIMEQTTKFDMPLRYPGSQLAHRLVEKVMK